MLEVKKKKDFTVKSNVLGLVCLLLVGVLKPITGTITPSIL